MSVCLFSPNVPHNWSIFDFIAQYNLVKSTKYEGPHYAQRTCKSPEVQSLYYLRSSERKNIDSFTYALTPWRIIIPEKLIGFQLVKKFPAFYGTPKFITAFTRACYLSLSWARSTQSMPNPTAWRSILIYPPNYAWVFQLVSFPQVSPPKHCKYLSFPPWRSGDRIPMGAEIFRSRPHRPWGQPSLLCNGYRDFPRGKEAGSWCGPPDTI